MAMPIGRRREHDVLARAIDAAVAGTRTVVHLSGAAGIGKSTLMDAARSTAGVASCRVLTTGLSAAETGLSWAGLALLLRAVPAPFLEGLPEAQAAALRSALGHGMGESDPLLVAAALARLLADLAVSAPVVVLVDDLHWLDRASAGALAYAIRGTDGCRVAFLLASRPTELPIDLARLVPADQLEVVHLDGLSVAGLKLVLEERFVRRLSRVELVRLHGTTGGNPFHALEAGRLLDAGQSFERSIVPPSLQAIVREHVGLLSPAATAVLRVAALCARPTVPVLERVCSQREAHDALVEGERNGVVQVDGAQVRFVHPTLIAALVESVGPFERRRLERALADAVDDPEERAVHLAAAADGHDEAAAAAMAEAGERAARRGAHPLAVEHLRRACDLTDPSDVATLRARRLLLADVLQVSGDGHAAIEAFEEVLAAQPTDDERWEAIVGLVIATAHARGDIRALDLLDRIDDAAGDVPGRLRDAARIRTRLTLHDDVEAAGRSAARFATLCADPAVTEAQRCAAAAMVAIVDVLRGEPVDVDGLHRAVSATFPDRPHQVVELLMEPLVWCDRFDLIGDGLEEVIVSAEGRGSPLELLNAVDQLADVHLRLGEWDAAQARLEQYCELSIAAFDGMAVVPRVAELVYVDAMRGLAGRTDEVDLPAARRVSRVEAAQRACRLGLAALANGDVEAAATQLWEAHELLLQVGIVDPGALLFRADLVEALVAVGRVGDASSVLALLERVADRSGRTRARAELARARAIVLATEGDLSGAAAQSRDASALFGAIPAPFDRAKVQLLEGQVARRSGRRSDARAVLGDARAVFARLGAVPFVRRVDDELARCGADTSTGGMTPTERQIAELVAVGRTNAEVAAAMFISVRTVESNLTKLYRKLGVRSRTELIRHLQQPGGRSAGS